MKTGIARKILQHLDAHGPATTTDLAALLGAENRSVVKSVATLNVDSKVQRVGLRWVESAKRNCGVYAITLLGREAVRKPMKQQPVVNRPAAFSRETGPAETVEEFEARGGKVQKLGTQWSPPTRYPRYWGVS